MAVKIKKNRNNDDPVTSNVENNAEKVENRKKNGNNSLSKGSNKSFGCDIFTDDAMENAYYVCHNVQDVLKARGFAWPDGQKKKKKGKR